jgi:hypothetical protein
MGYVRPIRLAFISVILLLFSACSLINPLSGEQKAEMTAIDFFSLLSTGEYEQASEMYAGDITNLQYFNPLIDENDLVSLWRNACTVNGFQCLPIKQVLNVEKFSLNEYFIKVEFQNPDGSLFVLGPCCGASEEEMPPVSQFDMYVIERGVDYFITSLPVLVP